MAAINHRFTHGGPRASVAEAGVLVHMFDGFEEDDDPWLFGNQCDPFPVDHYACSLIHASEPWLFPGDISTAGLILSAKTELLCLYTEDAGSGGKVNGGCGGWWQVCVVFPFNDLPPMC